MGQALLVPFGWFGTRRLSKGLARVGETRSITSARQSAGLNLLATLNADRAMGFAPLDPPCGVAGAPGRSTPLNAGPRLSNRRPLAKLNCGGRAQGQTHVACLCLAGADAAGAPGAGRVRAARLRCGRGGLAAGPPTRARRRAAPWLAAVRPGRRRRQLPGHQCRLPAPGGERLGLGIEPVLFDDWQQAQDALRERRVDVLPSMAKVASRESWAAFSEPYLVSTSLLFTRRESAWQGLGDLAGKRVAVERGYAVQGKLRERAPGCCWWRRPTPRRPCVPCPPGAPMPTWAT